MSLWSRISNALRGERLNREIEEELRSHIEEAIASGRDPEEARRAFGSALRAREASHSIRAAGWLESLLADVSFGWRQLCRNKVASAAAVLSLPSASAPVSPPSVLLMPCSGARCPSPAQAGSTSSPVR